MPLAVVIHPIFTAIAIAVYFTLLALLDNVADYAARDSSDDCALNGVIAGRSTYSSTAYAPDKRPAANAVSCASAQ